MKKPKISQNNELYTEYNDWCAKQPKIAPEALETLKLSNLKAVLGVPDDYCLYCGNKGYIATKFGNVEVCQACLKSGKLGWLKNALVARIL